MCFTENKGLEFDLPLVLNGVHAAIRPFVALRLACSHVIVLSKGRPKIGRVQMSIYQIYPAAFTSHPSLAKLERPAIQYLCFSSRIAEVTANEEDCAYEN